MDKFAQFFICSTFNESIVEREIKIVDNKFSNNLKNYSRRFFKVQLNEINENSPFHNFGTGNENIIY